MMQILLLKIKNMLIIATFYRGAGYDLSALYKYRCHKRPLIFQAVLPF